MIPIRLNPPRPGQPFPQMSEIAAKAARKGPSFMLQRKYLRNSKLNSGRGLEQTEAKLGQT